MLSLLVLYCRPHLWIWLVHEVSGAIRPFTHLVEVSGTILPPLDFDVEADGAVLLSASLAGLPQR